MCKPLSMYSVCVSLAVPLGPAVWCPTLLWIPNGGSFFTAKSGQISLQPLFCVPLWTGMKKRDKKSYLFAADSKFAVINSQRHCCWDIEDEEVNCRVREQIGEQTGRKMQKWGVKERERDYSEAGRENHISKGSTVKLLCREIKRSGRFKLCINNISAKSFFFVERTMFNVVLQCACFLVRACCCYLGGSIRNGVILVVFMRCCWCWKVPLSLNPV